MTAFSTFTYAKKYFVSPEIEFVTEPDLEFNQTYKPPEDLINLLADNVVVYDKVGIGSTTPTSNLTVNGSVLISGISTFEDDIRLKGPLQDKFANPGTPGQVLLSDSTSVFWGDISGIGTPLQTIGIYDEGLFQGTASNLNFLDGTDPNNLVSATIGVNTSFANIVISDRWSLSGSDIYRMSKVGIQNASPTSTLDITGTLHATGAVDFDSNLNVTGVSTFVGEVKVNTGIVPDADEGAYLGTAALPFSEAHIGEIRIANSTNDNTIDTATGDLILDSATNLVNVQSDLDIDGTLNVDGASTLQTTLNVKGATDLDTTLNVDGATTLQTTLNVKGATDLDTTLNVDGAATLQTTLNVKGATDLDTTLNVDGAATLQTTLNVKGATDLDSTLNVDGTSTLVGQVQVNTGIVPDADEGAYLGTAALPFSEAHIGEIRIANSTNDNTIDTATGDLILDSATNLVNVQSDLTVDANTKIIGTLELDSSLIDINNSTATGKFDYRLSSVGTGVSWRPPGVQTQNAIWVTVDGNDSNSGYLEGDAKRTIGAAASIAESGDTIFIRSGVYYENNPIGLRTDVSVSGQDLRLVTIVPNNVTKDVFHVRRGCLVENLNFAGSNVSIAHTGCGAVAFPPTNPSNYAVSGYIAPGPATEGPSGRWRSPYIRNCTNFMTKSIGMRIDGDHATASTIGADLKSMVCDSFTQYNEAGIGVSITNNGYAQLVSIFTINCDIGIYADSGGSCDLTNSNSSFGNFGLVAVGLGSTEFTGKVLGDSLPEVDTVTLTSVFDTANLPRRPYDGQSVWFKINLDNYPDAVGSGVISGPLRELGSIQVLSGGSGFSATSPPNVIIRDADGTVQPKGPQGIIAEVSPTVNDAGQIVSIDVVSTGRNYLASQNIVVDIEGNTGLATAIMAPIYYTVSAATPPTSPTGISTVTFNEFIPYELFNDDNIELRRISRILTSSHSFEYIGTGTDINTATPLKGAVPIKANEVVARDGAQIPFTSTDQKGNFDIGAGIQIDQTTSSIRGRDFSRAIQAEVTPLILALR